MANPSDPNTSSDSDQPEAPKTSFELESPSTTPPLPVDDSTAELGSGSTSSKSSVPADGQTFELHETPPVKRPPRVGPPSVSIPDSKSDVPPPPKWPDLLAIICMMFGGAGLLIHLLEIAGHGMSIMGWWENVGRAEKDELSYFYLIPALLLAVAAFFFSGILLTGGLALYKRWPWCTRWLNTWALIKIPLVILLSLLGWAMLIMPAYHMFAGHDPETKWTHYHTAFMLAWSFIWLIWSLLLPVFIIVWFRKKKVRDLIKTWE